MTEPEVITELTGRLLVATPVLGDPNFARAVVFVLDHDESGALGVVVNRPTTVPVAEVLPSWQPFTTDPGVLFQGGPVALDSALGLAVLPGQSADEEPLGWRRVIDGLGLVDRAVGGHPAILGGRGSVQRRVVEVRRHHREVAALPAKHVTPQHIGPTAEDVVGCP